MSTFKLKRKNFAYYDNYGYALPGGPASYIDESDNLKRMRDSDILAAPKRRNRGWFGRIVGNTVRNAGIGAAVGAGLNLASSMIKGYRGGGGFNGALKNVNMAGLVKGAKLGAGLGGAYGAYQQVNRENQASNQNSMYNARLGYAKRQAARRERADWKNNMTQREGYSY